MGGPNSYRDFPPSVDEIDRMAAGEKVRKMRDVEALAKKSTPMERARWAKTFHDLAKQFEAAALRLDRYVPDGDEVPEFIREGSTVELRKAGGR